MHVIATFAFGYDWDTAADVATMVDLVKDNGLSLNVFILHDTEMAESADLLVPLERRFATHYQRTDPQSTSFYDYLTGSFATYFPKRMKPSTLQQCIIDAYDAVYTRGHVLKQLVRRSVFESLFGLTHSVGIRAMNASVRRIVNGRYMDHLRTIEEGLYDENEVLIEERLGSLDGLPPPPPLPDACNGSHTSPLLLLGYGLPIVRFYVNKGLRRLRRVFRRKRPHQ
jgi:hypothetical protein